MTRAAAPRHRARRPRTRLPASGRWRARPRVSRGRAAAASLVSPSLETVGQAGRQSGHRPGDPTSGLTSSGLTSRPTQAHLPPAANPSHASREGNAMRQLPPAHDPVKCKWFSDKRKTKMSSTIRFDRNGSCSRAVAYARGCTIVHAGRAQQRLQQEGGTMASYNAAADFVDRNVAEGRGAKVAFAD